MQSPSANGVDDIYADEDIGAMMVQGTDSH